MPNFIARRLKQAREETGLTQEAFARSLGLSSEFISLLEAGKRTPSLDTLSRIAAHLHRDPSFFLGEKDPAFTVLFRAAEVNAAARAELEHFQRYVEDYLRLEEATGSRLELAPLYSLTSPERMAAEERRRLGLGDEPMRDIFALIERGGCHVLRRPLPSAVGISGAFIYLEALGAAFVMINSAQTLCRQIFSAAHEYCHYLKDRNDPPGITMVDMFLALASRPVKRKSSRKRREDGAPEGAAHAGCSPKDQFAQEFAAHFLMPSSKVREIVDKDLGGRSLGYDEVLYIKRYFGVSAQAMLRCLRGHDAISASQFDEWIQRDPVPRERQIFGGSEEECYAGPGRARQIDKDASPVDRKDSSIVSDRFKLLAREATAKGRLSDSLYPEASAINRRR